MATNRSYQDNCGMAHALDLVGERWSLLVVRELMFGPKRFTDLKRDLPGISTNMLTDRLTELERHGVLHRVQLPPPAGTRVYELTRWGLGLEPAIQAIGRWGASSPTMPVDHHVSAATAVMSMRTNFAPDVAADPAAPVRARVAFRFGPERFLAVVDGDAFEVGRGEARPGDVVLTAAPAVLAGMLYGGLDPATAVADGVAQVERLLTVGGDGPGGDGPGGPGGPGGQRAADPFAELRRFLGVFRLPAPAFT